ncbi:hypothetical protein Mgra_00005930 [Meloidogyne graminicola]|uniref:Uncharacterized protein n=1 Tax=Meloidogyne graminicola TaxID=189291 RepID=A0A8S9ZN89_9BILA|nr:hypothetical protein Mgra_00005930 [Meloidogyne graminicola]
MASVYSNNFKNSLINLAGDFYTFDGVHPGRDGEREAAPTRIGQIKFLITLILENIEGIKQHVDNKFMIKSNEVLKTGFCELEDDSNNLWVACKGGLFKFDDSSTKKLVFSMKNDFPKKIAAYPQILLYKSKLIYVTGDSELIQFRILDQSGNIEHSSFIEGKVQSLAITKQGDLFMTKQMKPSEQTQTDSSGGMDESIIWRSHIDFPSAWDEFSSSFDECFQCLCLLDDETLAVSVASIPVNIYSKFSGTSICDDWIESIKLNGSRWTPEE